MLVFGVEVEFDFELNFEIKLETRVELFRLFYFYLFYFICHTIITKNKGKEKKKDAARRPNRNCRSL